MKETLRAAAEERSEVRNMLRLGLVGCGSIGSTVAAAISRGSAPGTRLVGVVDPMNPEAAARVGAAAGCVVCPHVESLLNLRPTIVLEAASAEAVRTYAARIFDRGADLMMVSIGALADTSVLERLTEHARRKGRRLLVPSGAIGGVDIIKAAMMGGLDECSLTTRKAPASLNTAYVREQGIDVAAIREATVIFEGTALEAVQRFPQNLNVAVTISLAGLGLERTTVRVIADPEATHNIHEVFVRGAFGEATIRLVNLPSAENPRSSSLVCYSVLAMLEGVGREFQLGA